MDLFEITGSVEAAMEERARKQQLPIGGTMELLPLCNMNCRMCYIRLSRKQMEKQGRMLSCDEWLHIAEEMRHAGVLFLMLTGGEPLMYPDFERLFTELTQMGFIITMNTNATLMDRHMADLIASTPIRRLNITLYGADDETYGRLCNNPKGFTQVMRAVNLIEERGLRYGFNATIVPENFHQIQQLFDIANAHHVKMDAVDYMFPPMRKEGMNVESFVRLSPAESVEARFHEILARNPRVTPRMIAVNYLRKTGHYDAEEMAHLEGPNCSAGRSGFWINWKGELMACGMITEPRISLLEHPFKESWAFVTEGTKRIKRCKKCDECSFAGLCPSCTAACLTETGSTDGCPEYLCQRTRELVRRCKEILETTKGEYDL
jgi:MoaA/NifB/PqqE/SkfB family radical SAM enzyme